MKKYLLLALVSYFLASAVSAQSMDDHPSIPVMRSQLGKLTSDSLRVDLMLKLADAYADLSSENLRGTDTAFQWLRAIDAIPASRIGVRQKGWYQLEDARIFRMGAARTSHDSAIYHIERAIVMFKPYRLDWAKACLEAAFVYADGADAHDYSLQIKYYKEAIPVFDSAGEKKLLANALQYLGGALWDPKEALTVLLRAADVCKSLPNPDMRAVYSGLAKAYTGTGDLQQALRYALLAVRQDEARAAPDFGSVLVYNKLAGCYRGLGDNKQAALNFGKSRDLAARFRDTAAIYANAGSEIMCDLSAGDDTAALAVQRRISASFPPMHIKEKIEQAEGYARIFLKMEKLDSMRPYVQELTGLDAELSPDQFERDYTLPLMAAYANRTGQFSLAQKYSRELIRLGHVLKLAAIKNIGNRQLASADSGLGNYKLALNEYQQYVELRDSLRDVSHAKQIASLNLQYETEKKDKDISSLNHQQQLNIIALRQASLTRNFIIGGVLLLLVLLAVVINRYRLKQRTNKQLELQRAEIGDQNLALRHLVKEKDWLVKEVHHRVKNNLQIIMSLLNSQSVYIDNEAALTAIHDSQHRVQAMSLIHQKLYNSENVTSIDMVVYIRELVFYLGDSLNTGQRIRFELNIEPLELDVSQAVPVGLILNEAITNSIKYAFPDNRKGMITVGLSKDGAGHCFLVISDNGVGIPSQFTGKRDGSLGMSLMEGLSADLDGSFVIENKDGTVIRISFIYQQDLKPENVEISGVENYK